MGRAVRYVEWLTAPILGVTAAFSYAHEQYGTAAACAGLVLGTQLGVNLATRRRG